MGSRSVGLLVGAPTASLVLSAVLSAVLFLLRRVIQVRRGLEGLDGYVANLRLVAADQVDARFGKVDHVAATARAAVAAFAEDAVDGAADVQDGAAGPFAAVVGANRDDALVVRVVQPAAAQLFAGVFGAVMRGDAIDGRADGYELGLFGRDGGRER